MTTPEGFNTVTPYLIVEKADEFIEFLKAAFDGVEIGRSTENGRILHAQVRIGSSTLMLSEASEEHKAIPSAFYLYVDDADAVMQRAMDNGASLQMEVDDMPYGDRQGGVTDQFGNIWWIAQRLEEGPYY